MSENMRCRGEKGTGQQGHELRVCVEKDAVGACYLFDKASSRVDHRGGANAHEQVTAGNSLISHGKHLGIQCLIKFARNKICVSK